MNLKVRKRRDSAKEGRNRVRGRGAGNLGHLRYTGICVHRYMCSNIVLPVVSSVDSNSSITLTWELVRSVHSWVPLQTYQIWFSGVEPMNLYFNKLVR